MNQPRAVRPRHGLCFFVSTLAWVAVAGTVAAQEPAPAAGNPPSVAQPAATPATAPPASPPVKPPGPPKLVTEPESPEQLRSGHSSEATTAPVSPGPAERPASPVGDALRPAPGKRLRVGLVLSGGGARGAAHVGVLKVLEDLRVPIDAIAGTSMGAVVGGLYATGFSAHDIERVVSTLNWQDAFKDRPPREELTFRRKQEDQNFLVKFPLGLKSGRFLLPKGLIQGQKLNQTLRKLTLPVARIQDFDELPTPFRAVATDLETGEAVVMGEGDLTSAMRASLSAPGVFSPVEREGRLLVDGGLSENLPIDVVRAMNVDVLIVVDVGFPLLKRDKLQSAPVISNQMLAILVRRDAERQKATLTKNDIVVEPALNDASSFDFGIVKRAIDTGEKAAIAATTQLSAYSMTQDAYSNYMVQREDVRRGVPRVDFVQVAAGSERYSESLQKLFEDAVGKPLDPDTLSKRVTGYYGKGNLEALDYELIKDDQDRYGLELTARRNSWGPNYIRFGLNLQDDFEGNSSYNAATRFVLSEITQPGGEWVWDLQVGETSHIGTEVYLPLSQTAPYFFLPHAELEARNVSVLNEDQQTIAEYRVRSFTYGLDFGREFGNWGEIRAGLRRDHGTSHVRVGDPTLPTGDFESTGYFSRLSYDRLDDVNFPRHGTSVSLQWDGQRAVLGADQTADRLLLDVITARTFGRQTAVWWTSMGTALNAPTADLRTLFSLGGFLNLSGRKVASLTAPHVGITRLLLYRQIGRGGPGFLDVPAYIGVSLEAGNVWQRRGDASFGSTRKDASLFLGLDTPIGPVYLATGLEQHGTQAFYLFLGRTF